VTLGGLVGHPVREVWMRWSLVLWIVAGCDGDGEGSDGPMTDVDADADADADADTDVDTDADTDVTTNPDADYPKPTTLTTACEVLANVLRFQCTVTVDPAQPVQISYAKTDGTGPTRVLTSEAVSGSHEIIVNFLEPETDYDLDVTATEWPLDPVDEVTIQGGVPPASVRSSLTVTGTSSVAMLGTHLPCNDSAIAVIYSTVTGRLLWYQSLDMDGQLGFLDMIQFTEDHTVLGETGDSVVEVDLTGRDVIRLENSVDYDLTLHHDIFKRDGQYYLLFQDATDPLPAVLDGFLVLDSTGVEIARWRSFENLDVPQTAQGDWMHTNTIFVDLTGDVYLSLLSSNSILKIEGDTTSPEFGNLLWVMQGDQGFASLGQDFVMDWSQIPGDDAFGGQHSALVRYDGRLMLLDNQSGRGMTLTVDEANLTATADEVYETVESTCGPQGTARDSLAGNSFVGCSGDDVREYDPAVGLVWDAHVECGGGFVSIARFYPLDDW
jgi:hypothetical protein